MRLVIVGLGIQGKKRLDLAGDEVVATVDPVAATARYRQIDQVPPESFDAAYVCTPDHAKPDLLRYLLARRKHVLVEKPLLAADEQEIRRLGETARSGGVACYTAYNHRFEPHLVTLKHLLDRGALGEIYLARFFYGNGTARDVRQSPWRDCGLGVLPDLGSHLLDLVLFFFGKPASRFEPWSLNRFENQAFDHALFGFKGKPVLELEASLISWRNTFSVDIFGDRGSAHVDGLCKWGPSTLTVRTRVLPSGRPHEEVHVLEQPDPTWAAEHRHFRQLCRQPDTNIENDLWINGVLHDIGRPVSEGLTA